MRLLAKKNKDDERGPAAAEETKEVEKKPSGKVSLGGKSFPTVLSKLKKWGDYNSFGHPMVAEMRMGIPAIPMRNTNRSQNRCCSGKPNSESRSRV